MEDSEFREKLANRAAAAGLDVSRAVSDALESYFSLLETWNRRISLTSLSLAPLKDEAIDRLLIEPLLAAKYASPGAHIVDIGSGGGSPAVPFFVAVDGASLVMVESRSRKAAFLREVVRQLGLTSVYVESSRTEDLDVAKVARADIVTIRAVRIDKKFLSSISQLVKPGGSLYLFAGPTPEIPNLPRGFSVVAQNPLVMGSSTLLILRSAS